LIITNSTGKDDARMHTSNSLAITASDGVAAEKIGSGAGFSPMGFCRSCAQMERQETGKLSRRRMVARDGVEPPTPAF
jgi:hypothetical protein